MRHLNFYFTCKNSGWMEDHLCILSRLAERVEFKRATPMFFSPPPLFTNDDFFLTISNVIPYSTNKKWIKTANITQHSGILV